MRGHKNETPEEIEAARKRRVEAKKRHYRKHKDSLLAKAKKHYQANAEKVIARVRQWEKEHPDRAREFRRKGVEKYQKTDKYKAFCQRRVEKRKYERLVEREIKKEQVRMEAEVQRLLALRAKRNQLDDDLELSKGERLFRHRQEEIKRELAEYAAKPKWVPRVHKKSNSKAA